MIFDDFGAVFRFQRFVKILRIIGVGKTLYLFSLLSPPFVIQYDSATRKQRKINFG